MVLNKSAIAGSLVSKIFVFVAKMPVAILNKKAEDFFLLVTFHSDIFCCWCFKNIDYKVDI